MDQAKRKFVEKEFVELLKKLKPDTKGKWGVMSAQQMVEHMSDAFRNASGKLKLPLITPADKLASFQNFALSDKPFKENTKNVLMSETPPAVKNADIQSAIAELDAEIKYFITQYEGNPDFSFTNPFFGELNFAGQISLLHKHAVHHATQFGLM